MVLRARFCVYLTALLPSEWQQIIRAAWVDPGKDSGVSTEMTVDLFENPDSVECAQDAITLCREGCTGQEISKRLGISRRTAYDAIKLAELMEQRGADEPYVELTEAPANASRWGQRQKDTVQEGDHSSD
ncbi:MAG: HTH domain-containing protein [Planctomycetota bacterium]|nr:HTH domain-containing protein [Planctomycetota bacterium]